MATTVILLTKDDINCRIIGRHVEIVCADNLLLNLNTEAISEIIKDLTHLKSELDKQD